MNYEIDQRVSAAPKVTPLWEAVSHRPIHPPLDMGSSGCHETRQSSRSLLLIPPHCSRRQHRVTTPRASGPLQLSNHLNTGTLVHHLGPRTMAPSAHLPVRFSRGEIPPLFFAF